jgi:GntR family transcriptional regulator
MLITLNEKDPRPLYLQIAAQVKDQVQRGDLQPGNELPSVRDLANSLGINLHTVRNAYIRLREQGVIDLRLGRRARVARKRLTSATAAEAEHRLGVQLRELLADAFLLGLSTEDVHTLIDRYSRHTTAAQPGVNADSEERP